MSLTLHCVNCHADIPNLNRLGRCTRCDSQAVLSVEKEETRELHRERVKSGESLRYFLPDYPALSFSSEKDAARFVQRVERSKSRGR
jgi:hypothetical protein